MLARVSSAQPVSLTAQRAWGIGGVVIEVISIVPPVLSFILAVTVNPDYGWIMLISLAATVAGGVIGMLAGIVGLVYAGIRRRGFVWPIVAVVLGIAVVAIVSLVFGVARV